MFRNDPGEGTSNLLVDLLRPVLFPGDRDLALIPGRGAVFDDDDNGKE